MARSETARLLEIANRPECTRTSREIGRSKLRVAVLLQLDATALRNAETAR